MITKFAPFLALLLAACGGGGFTSETGSDPVEGAGGETALAQQAGGVGGRVVAETGGAPEAGGMPGTGGAPGASGAPDGTGGRLAEVGGSTSSTGGSGGQEQGGAGGLPMASGGSTSSTGGMTAVGGSTSTGGAAGAGGAVPLSCDPADIACVAKRGECVWHSGDFADECTGLNIGPVGGSYWCPASEPMFHGTTCAQPLEVYHPEIVQWCCPSSVAPVKP